jgi:hypothetical protein
MWREKGVKGTSSLALPLSRRWREKGEQRTSMRWREKEEQRTSLISLSLPLSIR